MSALMGRLLWSGVKVLLTGAAVEVEARGRGSDVMHLTLKRCHFKVRKIT